MSRVVSGSLGGEDLEHPRAAHGTHAFERRPAVGHLHFLRVGDLAFRLAFHAVPFVRGHRALSTLLRHFVPPFGGRGRGNVSVGSLGRLPLPTPAHPRPGRDNIIPPAEPRGAGLGPGCGRGVGEADALVRAVTERLRGRSPTAAQDNDFRRSSVLARRHREFPPVGGHDLHGPLDDERAVGLGSDGDAVGHGATIRERAPSREGMLRPRLMPIRCWPVLAGFALGCVSEHGPLTNRMSQAATPYLARAAREPVSWQPWGRDAFALAARLDRPLLLYIGAADCRWCGVMDREVYGDPGLGALIDSLFVPVRVDRDERPDVAHRYGAAVRALAGLSGYPVTAFLTPDGSAFF